MSSNRGNDPPKAPPKAPPKGPSTQKSKAPRSTKPEDKAAGPSSTSSSAGPGGSSGKKTKEEKGPVTTRPPLQQRKQPDELKPASSSQKSTSPSKLLKASGSTIPSKQSPNDRTKGGKSGPATASSSGQRAYGSEKNIPEATSPLRRRLLPPKSSSLPLLASPSKKEAGASKSKTDRQPGPSTTRPAGPASSVKSIAITKELRVTLKDCLRQQTSSSSERKGADVGKKPSTLKNPVQGKSSSSTGKKVETPGKSTAPARVATPQSTPPPAATCSVPKIKITPPGRGPSEEPPVTKNVLQLNNVYSAAEAITRERERMRTASQAVVSGVLAARSPDRDTDNTSEPPELSTEVKDVATADDSSVAVKPSGSGLGKTLAAPESQSTELADTLITKKATPVASEGESTEGEPGFVKSASVASASKSAGGEVDTKQKSDSSATEKIPAPPELSTEVEDMATAGDSFVAVKSSGSRNEKTLPAPGSTSSELTDPQTTKKTMPVASESESTEEGPGFDKSTSVALGSKTTAGDEDIEKKSDSSGSPKTSETDLIPEASSSASGDTSSGVVSLPAGQASCHTTNSSAGSADDESSTALDRPRAQIAAAKVGDGCSSRDTPMYPADVDSGQSSFDSSSDPALSQGPGPQYFRRHGRSVKPEIQDATTTCIVPTEWDLFESWAAHHHNTSRYEIVHDDPPSPVLRRGQPFLFQVTFSREYNPEIDSISFLMQFEHAHYEKIMNIAMPVQNEDSDKKDKWFAKFDRQSELRSLVSNFKIFIPATAQVGRWTLLAKIQNKETEETREFRCYIPINILFNPWCKEDAVYLADEQLREEYVLKESGRLFRGVSTGVSARNWVFGQFEKYVLSAVFLMLNFAFLEFEERSEPVHVARSVCRRILYPRQLREVVKRPVCVMDEYTNHYSDEENPLAWTGSAKILYEFLQTARPVKYGENWIYSGLLVTACRALGIPCRSVTVYETAHNPQGGCAVEVRVHGGKLVYESGCPRNYHVFNEVWMNRHDLKNPRPSFHGWQVLDPMPRDDQLVFPPQLGHLAHLQSIGYEELREVLKQYLRGTNESTLVPVAALHDRSFRLGEVMKSMYLQINSDILYIRKEVEVFQHDPRRIGSLIVTENVCGDPDKLDILDLTEYYKAKPGTKVDEEKPSEEQVFVVRNVLNPAIPYPDPRSSGLECDLIAPTYVYFGGDLSCNVQINNISEEKKLISCYISASSIFQTGLRYELIKEQRLQLLMEAGERKCISLDAQAKRYTARLSGEGVLKFFTLVQALSIEGSSKKFVPVWIGEKKILIVPPTINIMLRGKRIMGEEILALFSFRNPLEVPLTRCEHAVEGAHLIRHHRVQHDCEVPPQGLVTFVEMLFPTMSGTYDLCVTFRCLEMPLVQGCVTINIK